MTRDAVRLAEVAVLKARIQTLRCKAELALDDPISDAEISTLAAETLTDVADLENLLGRMMDLLLQFPMEVEN